MIDRFDRSIIAMLGGLAMILTGVLSQDEAIRGVDFNTLGLLTGMMVLVSIARRSGIFEYLAIRSVQLVRGSPAGLLCALAAVTALMSALLDNVTTVMLVAPVTLSVARRLHVPPYPFLLAEVMASNIGGTATLIGDPPNMLIGTAANLSFNDFLVHLTPAIAVVMVVHLLATHFLWGRHLAASAAARAEVMAIEAISSILDRRLLVQATTVFALVLVGFITSHLTGLEAATVALAGAILLLLIENLIHHRDQQSINVGATYGEIDWITVFFFIGLFIVVHGVQSTGMLDRFAQDIVDATRGRLDLTVAVVLWSSAIISAVVDNVPFVAAMIPLIKAMAPALGGDAAILPLWVALSLGACLGGNGTLIGSAANLTVAGIAEREGFGFGFATYTRHALPLDRCQHRRLPSLSGDPVFLMPRPCRTKLLSLLAVRL